MKKLSHSVSAKLTVLAMLAAPFFADTVVTPLPNGGDKGLQGTCSGTGDSYFPPGKLGVYGCIKANGNSAFCGGPGKYKNTCTATTAKLGVVKPGHIPSQSDVQAISRANAKKEKPIKARSAEEFLNRR